MQVEPAVDESLEHLLSFLDLKVEHITTESCIVVRDILRKFPERYEEVIPGFTKVFRTIEEERGKCAVIWMIGEFGQSIRNAPYVLESFIDGYDDEKSTAVRMELLTASLKLFFKRPPEVRSMLGRLLQAASEDAAHVDVRDRALLYYRLLQVNVNEASRVVNAVQVLVQSSSATEAELAEELFKEFNSCSIVYEKPALKFIGEDSEDEEEESEDEEEDEEEEEDQQDQGTTNASAPPMDDPFAMPVASAPAQPATADTSGGDLLDLMGGFDLGGSFGDTSAPAFTLKPGVSCDKKTFQSVWQGTQAPTEGKLQLNFSSPAKIREFESTMIAANFAKMASGAMPNNQHKFFFYAQDTQDHYYFLEIIAAVTQGALSVTAKSQNQAAIGQFVQTFQTAIAALL
jgi:hypothetical protein